MKNNLYIIVIVICFILGLSFYQAEQNKKKWEDAPTMQLKDAGQDLMNRRKIQDSIDNANQEDADRDERNAYIMALNDSIDEAQQQNNHEQEQSQQEARREYPVCNRCGNEIKSTVYYVTSGFSYYQGWRAHTNEAYAQGEKYHQKCAEEEADYKNRQ
jgi:cbb3-type cytochrome oxidase subunit 3